MGTGAVDDDFAEFYRLGFGRLVGSLRSMAGPAAEDVAQEAFIVAHERWDEVAAFDMPLAWVRRVAIRIAGRRTERDRKRAALEARLARRDDPPIDDPDVDLVAAVAELPDRHAAAVWLYHVEDRPVVEVADRLGCSVAAAKVLLLRNRRRLAERVSGLTGRWISERVWTPDGIVDHLKQISAAKHVGAVLDEDLEGRGGRWELTIGAGAYTLFRDDGMRLDFGSCNLRGSELELVPALAPGHVLFRTMIDGDQLRVGLLESTTSPPHLGVPEPVWWSLFLESARFGYAGRPRPRL